MHSLNLAWAARSFWKEAVRCSSSSSSCFFTAVRFWAVREERSICCCWGSDFDLEDIWFCFCCMNPRRNTIVAVESCDYMMRLESLTICCVFWSPVEPSLNLQLSSQRWMVGGCLVLVVVVSCCGLKCLFWSCRIHQLDPLTHCCYSSSITIIITKSPKDNIMTEVHTSTAAHDVTHSVSVAEVWQSFPLVLAVLIIWSCSLLIGELINARH